MISTSVPVEVEAGILNIILLLTVYNGVYETGATGY